MKYTERYLRDLLAAVVEEEALACRAVLKLCGLELTEAVPSAAVTLGDRPLLRLNPVFLAEHCRFDEDVRFVLLHECMHVALRHTVRFKRMTPELNIALDIVINSFLCRKLGASAEAFLMNLYGSSTGWARLLAPPPMLSGIERISVDSSGSAFERLHWELWSRSGQNTFEDICDLLPPGVEVAGNLLLGNHEDGAADAFSEVVKDLLDGYGVGQDVSEGLFADRYEAQASAQKRRANLRQVLRRVLESGDALLGGLQTPDTLMLPWHAPRDRRMALAQTAGILPFSPHDLPVPAGGSVQVYVDVSGSMGLLLPDLLGVLQSFAHVVRLPVYAFSTVVEPAKWKHGRLNARSTGGTRIGCVFEHCQQSGTKRALVFTDGYVEACTVPPGLHIEAVVPFKGYADTLREAGVSVTHLPQAP